MRTYFPKQGDIEPKWFIIDAEGKILGRLSTEIAKIITGKTKPTATTAIIPPEPSDTVDNTPAATTDKNGMYALAGRNQHADLVVPTTKDQSLSSAHDSYLYQNNFQPRPAEQTVFFTDRSLYRPGQTVHFKGICVMADTREDNYKVLPNRKVTVVFNDPNGKEIAKPEPVPEAPVVDLLEALKKSVAEAKERKTPSGSSSKTKAASKSGSRTRRAPARKSA